MWQNLHINPSDKKVASVNGKGVVKAKKKGKATITIKAGQSEKNV